tara:strand:- start:293 stop:964 length:672 start_codon:yes stop_codon:yes gene_type:complete
LASNSVHKTINIQTGAKVDQPNRNGTQSLPISDEELWSKFKLGSETAYALIYKDNVAKLYSYGLKLVNNKDLVKDAIQDLFVEIWDSKQSLGNVRSIKSYLFTAIRRKLIWHLSKQKNAINLGAKHEKYLKNTPSAEFSLIEKQRFDEERKSLLKVMEKLNDKQREIIHLKYYSNFSYEEISEIMSLDKKATYNLMAHTIKLLRQHLEGMIFFTFYNMFFFLS